jgi:preprotein translocase subunit SecE
LKAVAKKNEAETQSKKESKSSVKDSTTVKSDSSSSFSVGSFLQGTREELGKVVWPSRQQLISESLAVILMVILSASLIYLVDNLFSWAATQVF